VTRIVRLTESDLTKLVSRIIKEVEETGPKLLGRDFNINSDYTISIQDKNNKYPKIKLQGNKFGMDFDINVKSIVQNGNNFTITTKKNNTYDLNNNTVAKIINFVDNDNPSKIDLGKATMVLKKV
jgi:hypothetical protein